MAAPTGKEGSAELVCQAALQAIAASQLLGHISLLSRSE